MKITFSCSGCGKTLKAAPDAAGRTRKCPVCATRVTCPARSTAPRRPARRISDDDVAEAEVVAIIPDAPAVAARTRPQPSPAAAPKPAFDPFDDLGNDPYQLAQPDPVSTAPPEPKKPCPMCGEMIFESAARCRYCGEVFDAKLRKSGSKRKKKKATSGAGDGGGTGFRDLGIGVVVLILGIGLTVFSYAHPATDGKGQGKFYIFHGFIIGGFAQTCKGLYGLIRGE